MSVAELKVATRGAVGSIEQRFGRKRTKIAAVAIGVVLLLLAIRACTSNEKKSPPPAPRPVETAKVIQKDVPLYLDEIGTCGAYETVQVQAQVSGQIMARDFKDGAYLKKGDLLFTIDPRPYEAALQQAQGQLGRRNRSSCSMQILKRQQELRARSVTSPQDLDTAQGTVNSDEAKVKSAEATVAAAQVNLDYCNIRSPIDGRAGLRNVDVGNVVTPSDTTPLLTIQGMDPIYTDFTVAEPDLPLVRQYLGGPNFKVLTDAEGDKFPPRDGHLYFIDNAVQPGAGTVKARAVTPNPDHALWPAQFVRVRLILDVIKNAKLVPNSAVQIGQNGPYIFVVKKDSTLDLRQVKVGQKQDGDLTVVKEGLHAGETVVTHGQLQLAPGAKVIAKEEKKSAPNESSAADDNAVP